MASFLADCWMLACRWLALVLLVVPVWGISLVNLSHHGAFEGLVGKAAHVDHQLAYHAARFNLGMGLSQRDRGQ